MLAIETKPRPSCGQIQEHLGDIGVTAGWDLEAKIDFELNRASQQSQRPQVRHNMYTDSYELVLLQITYPSVNHMHPNIYRWPNTCVQNH